MRHLLLLACCTCLLALAAEEGEQLGSEDSQVNETITAHAWVVKIGNHLREFAFAEDGSCKLADPERAGTWRHLAGKDAILVAWPNERSVDRITFDLEKGDWYYARTGYLKAEMRRKKSKEEIAAERQAAQRRREEEEEREEEKELRRRRQESFDRLVEEAKHRPR